MVDKYSADSFSFEPEEATPQAGVPNPGGPTFLGTVRPKSYKPDEFSFEPETLSQPPQPGAPSTPAAPALAGRARTADALKGVGEGIGYGAASIAGMPRDIATLGKVGGEFLREKAGSLQGMTPEQKAASEAEYNAVVDRALKKTALPRLISNLPSTQTIKGWLDPYLPHPTGEEGKVISHTGATGISMLPGGVSGMLGRFGSGIAGGLVGATAGKAIAENNKDNWLGTVAQPALEIGTILGTQGLLGLGQAGRFDKKAKELLEQDYRKDLSLGAAKTPEQIKELQGAGVPVTLYDAGGPNVKRRIESSVGKTEASVAPVDRHNIEMQKAGEGLQGGVTEWIQNNILGGKRAGALSETESAAAIAKAETDAAYALSRSNPAAAAIPKEAIGDQLLSDPVFRKAMKSVNAENTSNYSGDIRFPSEKPGVPAVESQWVQTPRGLVEMPGKPAVPAAIEPGNLAYWDRVKRALGDVIDNNTDPITRKLTTEGAEAYALKKGLTERLDNIVGEYGDARKLATEQFAINKAQKLGTDFFSAAQSSAPSSREKIYNITKNFDSLAPEAQELFKHGFVDSMIQKINANPREVVTLYNKLGGKAENQNFIAATKKILGDDQFHELRGQLAAQSMLQSFKPLDVQMAGQFSPSGVLGIGAAAAGAAEGVAAALFQSQMIGLPAAGTMLGAAALSRLRANATKQAEAISKLAFSPDPASKMKLSRAIEANPMFGEAIANAIAKVSPEPTLGRMQNVAPAARAADEEAETEEPLGLRPSRATGGRISLAKTKAAKLMSLAETYHRENAKDTEPLLNHDDSTIAKALAVASRSI